jgi:hypothetical protein
LLPVSTDSSTAKPPLIHSVREALALKPTVNDLASPCWIEQLRWPSHAMFSLMLLLVYLRKGGCKVGLSEPTLSWMLNGF